MERAETGSDWKNSPVKALLANTECTSVRMGKGFFGGGFSIILWEGT